jgi:hypothetical protein
MGQSFGALYVHIIFSTRHREPTISKEMQSGLHAYFSGILENQNGRTNAFLKRHELVYDERYLWDRWVCRRFAARVLRSTGNQGLTPPGYFRRAALRLRLRMTTITRGLRWPDENL